MSSAANHRKRSHRSEFRARPYQSTSRQMVGTPTMHKGSFWQLIKKIRGAMRRAHYAVHQTDTQTA